MTIHQRTLRTNIRTVMADRGLKHRHLADLLDLPVPHVSNRLNAQWWSREEVDVLADHFDLSPDELIGDSLFRDDPEVERSKNRRRVERRQLNEKLRRERIERYREEEAAREAAEEKRRNSRGALCCGCGNLNPIDMRDLVDSNLNGSAYEARAGRWVGTHWCAACESDTRHAILKAGKKDLLEDHIYGQTSEQKAKAKLDSLVARLAGFWVDIHYRPIGSVKWRTRNGKVALVSFELDDSKGQWRIEINPQAPALAVLPLLERAWHVISTDDQDYWEGLGGLPTDGAWLFDGAGGWSAASAGLFEEIARHLDVEHTKLLLDVRDQMRAEVDQ